MIRSIPVLPRAGGGPAVIREGQFSTSEIERGRLSFEPGPADNDHELLGGDEFAGFILGIAPHVIEAAAVVAPR